MPLDIFHADNPDISEQCTHPVLNAEQIHISGRDRRRNSRQTVPTFSIHHHHAVVGEGAPLPLGLPRILFFRDEIGAEIRAKKRDGEPVPYILTHIIMPPL